MRIAFDSGNFQEAIRLADRLLSFDTSDFDAISVKARTLAVPDPEFCNYEAAVTLAKKLVDRDPLNAANWVELAEIQKMSGLYVEAQASYRNALEIDPDNYDALVGLASLFRHPTIGLSLKEARQLLERGLKSNPSRWEAHLSLAQLLNNAGNKDQAVFHYTAALKSLTLGDTGVRRNIERELETIISAVE